MVAGEVEVAGARIAWRAWGPREAPALLLVHGGAANQHWWDAVLPRLDPDRRIVTFDLSGHGASAHRLDYDPETWGRELEAVIATTTRGRATVVAHSMGGRVALAAAPILADRVEALILLDVPVALDLDPELHRKLRRPRKTYATAEEAVRAFRVVPGTADRDDVVRQVATASVTVDENGAWSYRGDPGVIGQVPNEAVLDGLTSLCAPAGAIRGGRSPFDDELCLGQLPATSLGPAPVVVLPHAGHHLMLDEPEALADAIESLRYLSSA